MSQHSKNSYTFEFCTYCATCEGLHEAQCGHANWHFFKYHLRNWQTHSTRNNVRFKNKHIGHCHGQSHLSVSSNRNNTSSASSLSSPCPFRSLASTQASFMQTSDTKYDVVCEAAEKRGWICLHDPPEEMDRSENNDWTVYWTDTSISVERVMKLQLFQKINHFPGMLALCRKTAVARNLNRIRAVFPEEYNFIHKLGYCQMNYSDSKLSSLTKRTNVHYKANWRLPGQRHLSDSLFE